MFDCGRCHLGSNSSFAVVRFVPKVDLLRISVCVEGVAGLLGPSARRQGSCFGRNGLRLATGVQMLPASCNMEAHAGMRLIRSRCNVNASDALSEYPHDMEVVAIVGEVGQVMGWLPVGRVAGGHPGKSGKGARSGATRRRRRRERRSGSLDMTGLRDPGQLPGRTNSWLFLSDCWAVCHDSRV